ncbi:MAG: GNAT family N-acetyltransferase [Candidatus Aminicenantes bacterium]|nr:GNAT family N-acetyltransferase [Candidatus Aminicenantes bacterium]
MKISEAILDDAESIARIQAVVHNMHVGNIAWYFKKVDDHRFVEAMRKVIQRTETYAIVAKIDEEIVGYAVCFIRDVPESAFIKENRYLYLEQIGVHPLFRRRGIGRELIKAILEYARQKSLGRVVLDTWEFNEEALRFFQSMGFEIQMSRLAMAIDKNSE